MRTVALLITFLVVPNLVGCAGTVPTIEARSATVRERTDEAAVIDIAFVLANAGIEPLELRWFDYEVRIEGVTTFAGRRAAEATLASRSDHAVTLPAVVPYRVFPDAQESLAGRRLTISGRLEYVAPGRLPQILLDSGVRVPHERFASTLTVNE